MLWKVRSVCGWRSVLKSGRRCVLQIGGDFVTVTNDLAGRGVKLIRIDFPEFKNDTLN